MAIQKAILVKRAMLYIMVSVGISDILQSAIIFIS